MNTTAAALIEQLAEITSTVTITLSDTGDGERDFIVTRNSEWIADVTVDPVGCPCGDAVHIYDISDHLHSGNPTRAARILADLEV